MYDPTTGRWLMEDPIDFGAGDPNLYRYVGNNPTNLTDPTGLQQVGDGLVFGEAISRASSPKPSPAVWTKTIRGGIAWGKAEGYGVWAHVLEHFLDPSGGEKETAPYKIPDEFIPEVKLHSQSMIETLLRNAGEAGKLPKKNGGQFSLPEVKVRWTSGNLILDLGERHTQPEKTKDTDEHMFRAYGGALVTISGVVTRQSENKYRSEWNVTATVTIRDNADFSAGGKGDIRHKLPGRLAEIYRAGADLQAAREKAGIVIKYWHTITFTSDYTIRVWKDFDSSDDHKSKHYKKLR